MGLPPTGNVTGLRAAGAAVSMSANAGPQIDVQGISDSSVPLFGMSCAEFGGS